MEVQSPIIQQPTNVANHDYKSQHLQDPQFSNIRKSTHRQPVPGVPIGLEPFIPLDHIFVKQQVGKNSVTGNRFDVLDGHSRRVFLALETTDLDSKCCRCSRNFTIDIMDFVGRNILTMQRQIKFCDTNDMISTSFGDGTLLGEVHDQISCGEKSDIKNPHGERILHMRGPDCDEECYECDAYHIIFTTHDEQIGVIRKTLTGFFRKLENFGVEFSRDLDVQTKALILAAVFLIISSTPRRW